MACCGVLDAVWKAHNLLRFENKLARLSFAYHSCYVPKSYDIATLTNLGIHPRLARAPCNLKVFLKPPPFSWVKVNTDSLSKYNPDIAACGGFFCHHLGSYLGGLQ